MIYASVYNAGITSVAPNEYLNLQPNVGFEAVVHNISHGGKAQLEIFDGNNSIVVDTQNEAGSWMGMYLHSTNTYFYRVKNIDSANQYMGADGVVTKES